MYYVVGASSGESLSGFEMLQKVRRNCVLSKIACLYVITNTDLQPKALADH